MIGLSGEKAGNHTAQESLQEGVRMSYFPFFGFGVSGSAFFGLPFPGTLRMDSRVSDGYTACLVKGFIPALCILASTVLNGKPSSLHISSIVMPSIFFIIGSLAEECNKCKYFPAFTIQQFSEIKKKIKKCKKFPVFYLTYCRKFPIFNYR